MYVLKNEEWVIRGLALVMCFALVGMAVMPVMVVGDLTGILYFYGRATGNDDLVQFANDFIVLLTIVVAAGTIITMCQGHAIGEALILTGCIGLC